MIYLGRTYRIWKGSGALDKNLLGIILIVAAYYDRKQSRIPNRLCVIGILGAFLYSFCFCGMNQGVQHFWWAAGLSFGFFPLWLLRTVGGGDIKLLAVVGFWLGEDSLSFLICAGICMGVHAVLIMLSRQNYFERMSLFFRYVMACFEQRKLTPYPLDPGREEDGGIRISYGYLAGHLLALLTGLYH
ncbi:MAG: hypothetical protein E7253_06795 [Lachnospiraceae bacterium]|nr:hypothetical protein [Lachnospiraceae bacterium]